ncbi:protein FAM133-like [Gigantopelta aegis]|uniref:protein FAM133-like n=1 Tax=Gigantopelta aegis TaxID=1735272 RepID=UPI001B88E154|nr:protein FAM133-like [Gigantopelta aegis]
MTAVELGSNSISAMNTVENSSASTDVNDAEDDSSKKKEEEELEKLAMNEILIETKRRAETARELGALGWQKSPLLPVNKQFLKNTLVSTLRSVPEVKKDKKLREQQIWKNPEYKRNYRRRNSDNDEGRSRHRDQPTKLDERDQSSSKDSNRRFRLSQPSNDRYVHSRHSDRQRSSQNKTRDSGSSKNSDPSLNKNELKSETDQAQTKEKGTNSVDNNSKENDQAKSDSKNDSAILNEKEMAVDNDLKLKEEEQNISNEPEHKVRSRSLKRKRSKTRGEKNASSKKRKHHSKHKKDGEKKHKSKRKSKKHKKKDSEM